jgi:hypothetical protein
MTTLKHDVIDGDEGGFSYRILAGRKVLLTSGTFLHRADADRIGKHIAADPVGTLDFIERRR